MNQALKFSLPLLAIAMIATFGVTAAFGGHHVLMAPKKPVISAAEKEMQEIAVRLNEIEPQAE